MLEYAEENALSAVVNRIRQLQRAVDDEDEQAPIEPKSLRHALTFLLDNRDLPSPDIGFDSNGLADLDWRLEPEGMIALVFGSNGSISFALTAPSSRSEERNLASGTFEHSGLVECILREFLA